VAYLLLKQAFAATRSDAEAAQITRGARERFVCEHLAPVAAPLAASLAAAGFAELSRVAGALAARVGTPAPMRTDLDPLAAASFACGACTTSR
jgi:hypothetical protein